MKNTVLNKAEVWEGLSPSLISEVVWSLGNFVLSHGGRLTMPHFAPWTIYKYLPFSNDPGLDADMMFSITSIGAPTATCLLTIVQLSDANMETVCLAITGWDTVCGTKGGRLIFFLQVGWLHPNLFNRQQFLENKGGSVCRKIRAVNEVMVQLPSLLRERLDCVLQVHYVFTQEMIKWSWWTLPWFLTGTLG